MATAMIRYPIDRRITRTRATLQHAFLSLLRKKDYEAVTIQDICDAANVGRSTFYAHFRSKDDLKRSSLEHLRALLIDRQRAALATPAGSKDRHFGFSVSLFEHARDHLDAYRALIGGRGGAVALGAIRQIVAELVRNELKERVDRDAPDSVPMDFSVHFAVGAYMAVLTWWLDRGAKLPAQRMDAWFQRLSIEGTVPLSSWHATR